MFRASSPVSHWDNLEIWLTAMTTAFQPKDAGDSEPPSQEQRNANLDKLTAHDPTQSYKHKDWAKIVGNFAHTLVAQARLNERNWTNLEQEATTLKPQAEEARRNQAHAQSRLDQLLLETHDQRGKEDATDTELQEEVEKLQNALSDLHLDTDQREQSEKETREELDKKLRRGEALLERAKTELKEKDTRAKACEKHLQAARAEIQEPPSAARGGTARPENPCH